MRNHLRAFPILLCLICFLFASGARADTITITGGSASVGSVTGGGFTLVGEGFVLNGSQMQAITGAGVGGAGRVISFTTANSGFDIQGGPANVGGNSYGHLFLDGNLHFMTDSFLIPGDSLGTLIITTPFEFHGLLVGCTSSTVSGCAAGNLVFNSFLVGQGTATMTFNIFDAGGSVGRSYSLNGIRYDFAPTQAPEPATIALLGTGLAGLGAALRRRRKPGSDKNS